MARFDNGHRAPDSTTPCACGYRPLISTREQRVFVYCPDLRCDNTFEGRAATEAEALSQWDASRERQRQHLGEEIEARWAEEEGRS